MVAFKSALLNICQELDKDCHAYGAIGSAILLFAVAYSVATVTLPFDSGRPIVAG